MESREGEDRIASPYRVWGISEGRRVELSGFSSLVIEARDGVEVELDLQPHASFESYLLLSTPPQAELDEFHNQGGLNDFQVVFVGANTLQVRVEQRRLPAKSKGEHA